MAKRIRNILLALAGLVLLAFLVYQIPYVKSRLDWRIEVWSTRLVNTLHPVSIPTPIPSTPFATFTPAPPTATATVAPVSGAATMTATPTVIPLPPQVALKSPLYEKQDWNSCGPATLVMGLRMYGWDGSQADISSVIKPVRQDRNVNPEELRYYILNHSGWLRAEFRVGGDLDLLKRLLAANYPVIIEEASRIEEGWANGPNDDMWDAHYILLTGYDDAQKIFITQDPQYGAAVGADAKVSYDEIARDWKPFNYLYMVIYYPEDEEEVKSILGADWDVDENRRRAMELSSAQTTADPQDAFAWFNLGASLTYFERYEEAAQAFDQAFTIGLPQRMTRYQFWPFVAYFNAHRTEYLLKITEDTYKSINNHYAEEALLWHGWGLWQQGDTAGAIANWRKALDVHPGYQDAIYALQYVGETP